MVLSVLSAVGAGISLIAWISGEGALPFIICAIIAITSYLGAVFTSVIMDFYDAIVTKHKAQIAILSTMDEDETKSQEK